jgi:hypothetical protein
MTLNQYYKQAILYPLLVIVPSIIAYSIIDNYTYKSEWLTADSVISIAIITAFIYCLIISLLSLSIFLNKYELVQRNHILTFLSWFLLPFGFISIVFIHEISFSIEFHTKLGSDFIYVIILNLPFIFGIIWNYIKYIKATDR